ncbi:LysR family transcriptional regulator [Pseudomonas sp. PA-6-1D]|uniref:LysR family transcriptional regulator n=1 Tax=Pseudomonas TaxID=286 RepID=UPI001EF0E583|nr:MULTISPECIES: LysR family transcriptional regulator [Pseudomonas]MCF5140223.1 LysR family transcriptional regulator [Pseudomonas sp. PA-6-3C]MCF5145406.1 LysR family transcriptional regulator [Pseudomonas sp. PA-6-3F]MCF5157720.1 LysR family transcriptional regulator [Pseudomonas sp. PA-6-2E]MCF5174017.1 LysR family transcriptional regulator [Pseudomonas sp. PA-6-1D]MCF5191870.1 LysR family transcriptional regulator [Pseudomonas sp. PA-6-1H]
MLELRQLKAFVAIAEEGYITRAAERLGMQQPPLTRLLQSLETQLGVVLMERLPRGVRPTTAGLALLDEARDILARAEGVADVVRRAARGERGRLAIGFTSSAALHPFVPSVLRRFREAFVGVSVVLEEAGTGELLDALVQEKLDAAFIRSPLSGTQQLQDEPILVEPMLLALPTDHPLALDAGGPLPLAALADEAFVLYRRRVGLGLYDAILVACREAGFSPQVVQEAPRMTATLSLVAAGLGVSIVPASMQRLRGDGIVYRELTECQSLVAPLHLATRIGDSSAVLRRFKEMVVTAAATEA